MRKNGPGVLIQNGPHHVRGVGNSQKGSVGLQIVHIRNQNVLPPQNGIARGSPFNDLRGSHIRYPLF